MCPDTEIRRQYGGVGLALLRVFAEQGRATFTTAEARKVVQTIGIAESYLSVLLHRLQQAGWIHRLKHGVYVLATGLPGFPTAHPFVLGRALIEPSAVSGWAALNHYGLTEQIPRVITLTTPKHVVTPAMRGVVRNASAMWQVVGQYFEIVTVVPSHFFGVEEVWLGDSRAWIFDRERALLDCFALPRRFGGLGEGLGIIDEHLHELDIERLVAHAERYGQAAVGKRVGYVLERAGVATEMVEQLQLLPMIGYRALDPTRPLKGERNKRWGIIENLSTPRTRA